MKLINKKTAPLVLFIRFRVNNILCTLTDLKGNTILWSTAGTKKLKGVKKITATVISLILRSLNDFSLLGSFPILHVRVKGVNKLKTTFIKNLKVSKFTILSIQDKLCLSYGGCKKVKSYNFR